MKIKLTLRTLSGSSSSATKNSDFEVKDEITDCFAIINGNREMKQKP